MSSAAGSIEALANSIWWFSFGMAALDNGRQDLLCRLLKAFDVATTPTPDTASATPSAPAQAAPSPNMSVDVNVA